MPELPEVETVRRALAPILKGCVVSRWVFFSDRLRQMVPVAEIQQALSEAHFIRIHRFGKHLLFESASGPCLHVHLGMTGAFIPVSPAAEPGRNERYRIILDNATAIGFVDSRRFGVTNLFPSLAAARKHRDFRELGPDALSVGFSGRYFHRALAGKTAPIKHILLDQKIVAGIGNIYASEALFAAGLHPGMPASDLNLPACEKLVRGIRTVLRKALRAGSTCDVSGLGIGEHHVHFPLEMKVYGQAGNTCSHCRRGEIQGIRSGGRSSFFCPVCQMPGTSGSRKKNAGKKSRLAVP
jgi:formamidopyrimidine-DNA glycosylase